MITPALLDIDTLAAQVIFDLSGETPVLKINNQSTGSNLPACTFWFVITSPSGTALHTGSLGTPDFVGAWTTWTMPDLWPQPFNRVEFDGSNPYTVTLWVQDFLLSNGAPASASTVYKAFIYPPNGNNQQSGNNFGIAGFSKRVHCSLATVFAVDKTKYLYRGSNTNGTIISQTWSMIYPPDNNGAVLPKQVITGSSYANFYIYYNGTGYYIIFTTVVSYAINSNCTVIFAYNRKETFDVTCNLDLCPLINDYMALISRVERGECGDYSSAEMKQKLLLINSKMNIVLASQNEAVDANIPELIEEIKKLGGFSCNCYILGSGILKDQPLKNCCPVVVPVYQDGHSNPFIVPFECPGAFQAGIMDAMAINVLGYAHDANEMISLINSSPSWNYYGIAFNMGPCQVGFFPVNQSLKIPPVFVIDNGEPSGGNTDPLAFHQNGNNFGATAVLGTDDNYGLNIKTNNVVRITISNAGVIVVLTPTTFNVDVSIGATNKITAGKGAGSLGSNTVFGANSGNVFTGSASGNSMFGFGTGALISSGANNSYFGNSAGVNTSVGGYNVFVGSGAGQSNTTGSRNIFIGVSAGGVNLVGADNVFIGYLSGNNTLGNANVFIGNGTGIGTSTGTNNLFIGNNAGTATVNGSGNVIIGGWGSLSYPDSTANNHIIISDGAGTLRLYVNPDGTVHVPNGHFSLDTIGNKLFIKPDMAPGAGTSPSVGLATLVGGLATIHTNNLTANSLIWIQYYIDTSGTPTTQLNKLNVGNVSVGIGGAFQIIASIPSSGFVATSDTSTVQYWIIN